MQIVVVAEEKQYMASKKALSKTVPVEGCVHSHRVLHSPWAWAFPAGSGMAVEEAAEAATVYFEVAVWATV